MYQQNYGKQIVEKIKPGILEQIEFEKEYKKEVTGFSLMTYLKGSK